MARWNLVVLVLVGALERLFRRVQQQAWDTGLSVYRIGEITWIFNAWVLFFAIWSLVAPGSGDPRRTATGIAGLALSLLGRWRIRVVKDGSTVLCVATQLI